MRLVLYLFACAAQVRENSTCGDRLTEGVTTKLQFLTLKDYTQLFSELAKAALAYKVAQDREGAQVKCTTSDDDGPYQLCRITYCRIVYLYHPRCFATYKVVRLVTAGLKAVQSAEQQWLAVISALKERKYSHASRHLQDAKRYIADAMRG